MLEPLASRLKETFDEKQRRNRSYSLRAMARDLEVSHSYLSLLLRGKRRPAPSRVLDFGKKLGWKADEARALATVEEVALHSRPPRRRAVRFVAVKTERYPALEQWHHLALLDLTSLKGFRSDARWIADRLRLSFHEVKRALVRLRRLGLLVDTAEGWRKSALKITFPAGTPVRVVRSYHRQMIRKALHALRSVRGDDYRRRDITAITFAANPARLDAAKKKVQRFRRELQTFLAEGDCTEIYQLNIQLFPLTSRATESP